MNKLNGEGFLKNNYIIEARLVGVRPVRWHVVGSSATKDDAIENAASLRFKLGTSWVVKWSQHLDVFGNVII